MTFIVIEGIDGCGGETQTKLLKKYFKKNKIPHKIFRSPDYTTTIGKAIKSYLDGKLKLDVYSAFTLFASDTLLTSKKIEKERNKKVVIMDRYVTSTLPYQCARGLDFNKGLDIIEKLEYQKPDLIIYIDIKPETSIKRKKKEKNNLDYHERNLNYLKKVRNFYFKEIENKVLSKWVVIDGEESIENVNRKIIEFINSIRS
ncbi:MAG: dTMP kinase [Candidatus Aenigmatarchaeota archaeon]